MAKTHGSKRTVGMVLAAVVLVAVAAVFAVRVYGRHLAIESGFPDFSQVVRADVYLYDEEYQEYIQQLTGDDFDTVVDAAMSLEPQGARMPIDEVPDYSGGFPKMFRLTLRDGEQVDINVARFGLFENYVLIDGAYAWKASDRALRELDETYERLIQPLFDDVA